MTETQAGNHRKIRHSDPASFRISESWFISFSGHSGNSEILSIRLPSIEKNGPPLSNIKSMAFPSLNAVDTTGHFGI
jgi:hypothetical protein